MAVEIQLKALVQNILVDFADAALPGRAGVGDNDIHAAEMLRDIVERGADRSAVGDISGKRQRMPADRIGLLATGSPIDITQCHLGAGCSESLSGPAPARAAGARDRG